MLQIKDIPPRPAEYDGLLCLGGVPVGIDEAKIRQALQRFGTIESCVANEQSTLPYRVKFTEHAAAEQVYADSSSVAGLYEYVFIAYNSRPYEGRGWCARWPGPCEMAFPRMFVSLLCRCVCENDLCGELGSRLSIYPKMMEALASLPPKMICLAEDAPPQEVTLEAGNLATRVATVKSRIDKAIFTTTSDKQKVLSLYEDYVKRIARALQSTLGLAGAEAVELALPAPPSVDAPTANPLRLADGQLMLYLPDAKSHRAGSEGRSQICVVRDERIVSALLGTAVQIELLVVGGNAELHLDSCSQVVLPWWPPVEGWAAAFQPEVTKLLGLKEQTLGLNEKVRTAEKVAKRAQKAQAKEAHAANEAKEAAAASQAAQAEAKEAKEEAKEAVERLANATEVKEDLRQELEELVQRIAARVT